MAHICDVNTGGFSMSSTQPVNSSDICYQNVRVLRTKQLELYDNVWSTDHNIICLTETWLNDMCYDHNLFPDGYKFPVLTEYVPIRHVEVECKLYPPEFIPVNAGVI
jgi:hypothetical protein